MRQAIFILWLTAAALPAAIRFPSAPPAASALDVTRAVRVDYVHRGGPAGERLRLDAIVEDGAWPGSRTQLIDTTGLGRYLFEVRDRASQRLLYSRGFASVYGEWETTPEFSRRTREFHESLRFPRPTAPVEVTIMKRDRHNVFQSLWSTEVDPGRIAIRRRPPAGHVRVLTGEGEPARVLDVLLISEAYSRRELPRFRRDAARLVAALLELEPFRSRRGDLVFRTLEIPGTPLSLDYNVFGLQRYALTHDNRALRNFASAAPADIVVVLADRDEYGGGGIFNQQSTVAAGNASSAYIFIHELAHNLAGLADEYVGTVTYLTGAPVITEPWEPNITALLDPAALKWRDLVEPDTPLPTPMSHAGRIGAFEGAGYEARGLYRSEARCIMGTRDVMRFCGVCQRAIGAILDLHTQ